MPDDVALRPPTVPPLQLSPQIVAMILDPINHALAGAERQLVALKIPPDKIIHMLLDHATSIAAIVEPPGVREVLVKEMVGSIASMVQAHVRQRKMTSGGILRP